MLKVTVASPTLSQGLNLNAAVLLVPSLHRAGKLITGEEFANVAGRAGRAFVDVEGLVVHVMHTSDRWRLKPWRDLVTLATARSLRSGLIQIVSLVLIRLAQGGVLPTADAFEYLANAREAWVSSAEAETLEGEDEEDESDSGDEPLSHLVEKLDAAVFSLIEALDADSDDLPRLLDEALRGSLWARQIGRESEEFRNAHKCLLEARARLIWNSTTAAARKGHFAMGVGLDTGLVLDTMSDELAEFVDAADLAALRGDERELAAALVQLGRRLLGIRPFVPDARNQLPSDWEDLLTAWVSGVNVETLGPENMGVIEDAFAYRLVWALEALRARRVASGWSSETIAGGGAAALETGVPQLMMAMLIRAGLPSRRAAMVAVRDGEAMFIDRTELREWMESDSIIALSAREDWPTAETAALWRRFREETLSDAATRWRRHTALRRLDLASGARPLNGLYRMEIDEPGGDAWVVTPDHRRLVRLQRRVHDANPRLYAVRFVAGDGRAHVERLGQGRAIWGPHPA